MSAAASLATFRGMRPSYTPSRSNNLRCLDPKPLRAPPVSRRTAMPAHAASLAGVAKYVSEAAARIFSPAEESDVPWERTAGSEFTGEITHHEDVARLKILRDAVRGARAEIEGCVDSSASNYNPSATKDDGSCTYVFDDDGELEVPAGSASAQDYVVSSISRIFGSNFKGDATEPQRFYSGGYKARARTSRELRKEFDRLSRFERVLDRTIASAKDEGKSS